MSWEEAVNSDDDGDSIGWANLNSGVASVPNTVSDVWHSGSESEEDATAKEMAKERAERERLLALSQIKYKKTFAEIQAEREAKDLLDQVANSTNPSHNKPLTAQEQREAMLNGLKAAEDADNLLTQELFGGESQSVVTKEKQKLCFENVVNLISSMKMQSIIEYEKLAALLSNKIPRDNVTVLCFLQNLLHETLNGDICNDLNLLFVEINKLIDTKKYKDHESATGDLSLGQDALPDMKKKAATTKDTKNENDGDSFDLGDLDNTYSTEDEDEEDDDGYDFM
jgi:hypothetical protein